MAPYTSSQRAMITQFCSFTQAKESIAAKHLKNQDWNVERAIDVYYGNISGDTPLAVAIGGIFDRYRDSDQRDLIKPDGAGRYLNDLKVGLEEPVVLALSHLLSSPSLGEFKRDDFINGWTQASKEAEKPLDTLSKQATWIAKLREDIRDTKKTDFFKQTYRAAFVFAKAEGGRSVPPAEAVEFWKMFFTSSTGGIDWTTPTSPSTPWLDLWVEFYEEQYKRPVNKDLWNMVGELMLQTRAKNGENLSWYSEDGAWPMAVDEFIAWVKTKRPELGASNKEKQNGQTDGANDVEMSN